ncbi:oxidoreductase family protein [Candidatus Uabimicrobium amorphum]|uniref:Phosphotransferase n=1 Tax=Uabimicrobium amorphum TaxID=2596890 RepID=A0A5S9II30_UABAM|nr:oxidoreductase family protein [Candidatus Uabimicrobium amorphum]BBM82064.1 phosphotransferase [Candidatus Uabimicrobium amorphum]
MDNTLQKKVCEATGASELFDEEKIQDLWSGYGIIARYALRGATIDSVVVKHICLPENISHPRGWNTNISHQRKIKSYAVETAWYKNWSHLCDENAYVPKCFAVDVHDNETLIVLEDLACTGFPRVKTNVTLEEIKVCVRWLAHFHVTFMGQSPQQLWETGTYWHLDTRPDELQALQDVSLKNAAHKIDKKLRESPFQTFVHGDAKLANFCFSRDGKKVAAVDFQYVGAGCGMKDLAYFIGSCLHEEECEKFERELLDHYFYCIRQAATQKNATINCDYLEENWRALFPVAWADFHRFLKGWSPGHWKINSYSEKITRQVVESL